MFRPKIDILDKVDRRPEMRRMVRELDGKSLHVGLPLWVHPQLIVRAVINEFGSKHIPSRPAFRTFFDRMERRISKHMEDGIRKQFLRLVGRFEDYMKPLGIELQEELRQAVLGWDTPPNAPRTVADKGFNDPLVGPQGNPGGHMWKAIQYWFVDKSE